MTSEKQRARLIELRDRALKNARRQKIREEDVGINRVRVRYTFWEQVARDYDRQIQDIVIGKEKKTPFEEEFLALLPKKVIIEGFVEKREIHINGVKLNLLKSVRVARHSPTGFGWGYTGSGPAQFALGILLKYVDKEIALLHYHNLKFGWVAGLPKTDFIVTVNLRKIMSDIINANR